jgi:pimeloyl-ACP methyl ester carboxylesterase
LRWQLLAEDLASVYISELTRSKGVAVTFPGAAALAALMLAGAVAPACGNGDASSEQWFRRVRFQASDGIRLDGRLFGSGSVGVVLSHMGRAGDSQRDWAPLARALARRGYLALTYNRRGVCPRGGAGCSQGLDDYGNAWRDAAGAVAFLRRQGAGDVVAIGASIGAMATLHAAAVGAIEPVGLVEFGGINHASGYDFERSDIARIGGRKLFLSSRGDAYGGADAAREWHRWAAEPKELELLPGYDHGTDTLRPGNALRDRVTELLVDFVERAAQAGG